MIKKRLGLQEKQTNNFSELTGVNFVSIGAGYFAPVSFK